MIDTMGGVVIIFVHRRREHVGDVVSRRTVADDKDGARSRDCFEGPANGVCMSFAARGPLLAVSFFCLAVVVWICRRRRAVGRMEYSKGDTRQVLPLGFVKQLG